MSKNPVTSLSQLLLTLNPYEFTTLAFIIGLFLSEGLSADEMNSLGNFYNLLGETMQVIAAQMQNLNSSSANTDIESTVESLKGKIGNIEDIIQKFKDI